MDTSKNNVPGKGPTAPVALPASMTPAGSPAPSGSSVLSAMTVGALVLGLLVGFGGGVLWNHGKHATVAGKSANLAAVTKTGSAIDSSVDVSTAVLPASNGVAVADQSAGSAVKVAHVTLAADAWVAVHDSAAGVPSGVLGAQWLARATIPI